ncbi:MAG: restriction endonuclease subunit S [Bacteroidetes bacterium]|nr:restriction endonuclease subunit S [Bacteroidota bacterium]
MNKEIKNKAIPKLRFPEFKNSGGWKEKTVSEVAIYENGKAHEQDIVEKGKYVVVNSKFISSNGEVRKYTNIASCLAKKGDILMVLSDVPNGKAIAKCFYVDLDHQYTVNQRICRLTPFDANKILLFYILNRNPYFLAFDDGVKQTNLKNEDVLGYKFLLPKDTNEQQKIADCLSSLDELITAENEKLEALKGHKKGLMQQLFPAEGKTIPRLRFSEFKNSGKWEVDKLGTKGIAYFASEKITVQKLQLDSYVSTENLLPNYGGKTIASKLPTSGSFTVFLKDDILLSNIRPYLKKVWFADINGATSNDVIVIRHGTKVCATFLSFLLKNDNFINYIMNSAEGVKMPRGDKDVIKDYPIKFPKPTEQEKIADCLSSLDDLIKAQAEKIEALKEHKKGLMQQLFPG